MQVRMQGVYAGGDACMCVRMQGVHARADARRAFVLMGVGPIFVFARKSCVALTSAKRISTWAGASKLG